MSKESRRRQRATAGAASATAGAAPAATPATTRPSTSPIGSPRVGRRTRSAPAAEKSFLERYRTLLIGVAVVAVVGVVGIGMFSAATQPVFACSTQWTPDGEADPEDPSFVQPDMGQAHLPNGTQVTYTYCPPASGKHYNGTSTGPIAARVYAPGDAVTPQGWIHNLEHGALVLLYRGDSDLASEAGQSRLQTFFDGYPNSPVCDFKRGTNVGPVFARFDDMAWPVAAMVWGRVLPLETFDEEAVLAFDRQWGERTNPESFCERPTGSPAAS